MGYEQDECNGTTGLMWDANNGKCVCKSTNEATGRYYYQAGSCVKCPSGTHVFTGTDCKSKTQICSGEHQMYTGDDYLPNGTPSQEQCACEDQYIMNDLGECRPCREFSANFQQNDCNTCMGTIWTGTKCKPCSDPNAEHTADVMNFCGACKIGYYKDIDSNCVMCPAGYATNDWTEMEDESLCTECISGVIPFNNKQYCCPEGGCCTAGPGASCLTCQSNSTCPTGTACDQGVCKRMCQDGMFAYYLGNSTKYSTSAACGDSFFYGTTTITSASHAAFNMYITDINAAEVVSIEGSNNGVSWDTLYRQQKTCNDNLVDCAILQENFANYGSIDNALNNHYYARYRITALWKDSCQSVAYTSVPLQQTPSGNGYYCSPESLPAGN